MCIAADLKSVFLFSFSVFTFEFVGWSEAQGAKRLSVATIQIAWKEKP